MEGKIKGGFTLKVVTKSNGCITEHTETKMIEQLCAQKLNEHMIKQNLAVANFFPPLSSTNLDITEKGMRHKMFLKGLFPPVYASQATKDFLSACKYDLLEKLLSRREDIITQCKKHIKAWGVGK